jgi:hypothetical protein
MPRLSCRGAEVGHPGGMFNLGVFYLERDDQVQAER